MPPKADFILGSERIAPGTRKTVDLAVSTLSNHTPVNMSVHVIHGRKPGPVMFVSAAVHGDEVIGVEIVRRLLRTPALDRLSGTLMAIPIVNAFGFLNHSRYLPDRRDLNRCFPGTSGGSLASRLANQFLNEVVARADVGIDLHSAAAGRTNLPQIRLTPANARLAELGAAFGAPVLMESKLRDGSLRAASQAMDVDVLLYEAGEGLRFDEYGARTGHAGILRVMHQLGMISSKGVPRQKAPSVKCSDSTWLRAPGAGLLRTLKATGDVIEKGSLLGVVSDPFGETEYEVVSDETGIIIGRTNLPIVNEGDALFHVGVTSRPAHAEASLEGMSSALDAHPLFDEDEII